MPTLKGVVSLDATQALASLQSLRREMGLVAKTPTAIGVKFESEVAAKAITKLRSDLRGLAKFGSEQKISLLATLQDKGAAEGISKLRAELQGIGKNPRVTVHLDTQAAQAAKKALGSASVAAKLAQKDVDGFGKGLLDDLKVNGNTTVGTVTKAAEQAARQVTSFTGRMKQAAKDDTAAIREAASAKKQADKEAADALRQQKQLGADTAREIESGYRRTGVSINRYGEEVKTVTGYLKKLAGEEKAAQAAVERANAARTAKIGKGVTGAEHLADQASMGATLGGVALMAGLGAATKAAIDYEDEFADVRKTVEGTPAQLDAISKALLNMSTKIPVSVSGLMAIASAGGQLGVAREGIIDFTKTVANLTTVTKMTGDAAGSEMAKIANIFQTPYTDFERMGSVIAKLSNIGASTEDEFIAMAKNIAGAGHTFGMSTAQVMGFANALTSLGIAPERGGTAFSKIIYQMGEATLNAGKSAKKGGTQLATFAQVAGVSAAKFKQLFDTDSTEAMTRFLEGLGKLTKDQKLTVLDSLGEKNIRVKDTLVRTAGAADLVRQSVDAASDAWTRNTFLTEKAALRNATEAAKLKTMWANVYQTEIAAGNALIPVLNRFADEIKPVITWFQDLNTEQQAGVAKMALWSAGGLLLIGRLKGIYDTGKAVRDIFIGIRAAMVAAQAVPVITGADTAAATALGGTGVAGAEAAAAGVAGVGSATVLSSAATAAAALAGSVVTVGTAAVTATGSIILYKSAQEKAFEQSEKLRGANADLTFSIDQVGLAFLNLSKTASVNPTAGKLVDNLKSQYDQADGKPAALSALLGSITTTRHAIDVNINIKKPARAELDRELGDLDKEIRAQITSQKYTVTIKAEADKGTLAYVGQAFHETYGFITDDMATNMAAAIAEQKQQWGSLVKFLGDSCHSIESVFRTMREGMSMGWYQMTGGWESALNKSLRSMAHSITGFFGTIERYIGSKATGAWDWFNGRTPNYQKGGLKVNGFDAQGPVASPSYELPAAPPTVHMPKPLPPNVSLPDQGIDSYLKGLDSAKKSHKELAKQQREAAAEAKRAEAERVRELKSGLKDSAQAYRDAADSIQASTNKTLDKLVSLHDGLKGLFSDAQSKLISMGVTNNPLGGDLRSMESLMGLNKQAHDAAAAAQSQILSLRSQAASAEKQQESVSIHGSNGGAIPAYLTRMAKESGHDIGLQCGQAITKALHDAGFKGTATSVARSGNARPNADGTYAPGTIFNFQGGKPGYRENHYAMVGADGQHWTESNWAGHDQVSTSRPINWNRDINAATWGGRVNAGLPAGVSQDKAFLAMPVPSMPASSLSGADATQELGTISQVLNGTTSLDGSGGAHPVGAGWGTPIQQNDFNGNRFAIQTKLSSGELDPVIAALSKKIGTMVGGTSGIGPVANEQIYSTLLTMKGQGIPTNSKGGYSSTDIALGTLRQIGNKEDTTANHVAKVQKDAADAIKAADDAAVALRDTFKTLYESQDQLRAQLAQTNLEASNQTALAAFKAGAYKEFGYSDAAESQISRFQHKQALNSPDSVPMQMFATAATAPDTKAAMNTDFLQSVLKAPTPNADALLLAIQGLTKIPDSIKVDMQMALDAYQQSWVVFANNQEADSKAKTAANADALSKETQAQDQTIYSAAQKSLKSAFDDASMSAKDLQKSLKLIPPVFKEAAKAGIDLSDTFSGWDQFVAHLKTLQGDLLTKQASEQRQLRVGNAVDDAQRTAGSLRNDIAYSKASRSGIDPAILRQEQEWQLGDQAYSANPKNPPRTADDTAEIAAVRKQAVAMMTELANVSKVTDAIGTVHQAWDQAFGQISTKGLSAFSGLFTSIQNQFVKMSEQILADKLWQMLGLGGDGGGLLGTLFGSLTGGAGGTGGSDTGADSGGFLGAIIGSAGVGGGATGSSGLDDLGGTFAGFASGIDRVPIDMLAQIHQGEMVLPALRAEDYRQQRAAALSGQSSSSSSGGGGSVTVVNVTHSGNVVANDPQSYVRQISQVAGRALPTKARSEITRSVGLAANAGRGGF